MLFGSFFHWRKLPEFFAFMTNTLAAVLRVCRKTMCMGEMVCNGTSKEGLCFAETRKVREQKIRSTREKKELYCTSSCKVFNLESVRFDCQILGLTLNFREKTSNLGDESLRSGEGQKEYTNRMVSSERRTSVQTESTAVLPELDLGRPVFNKRERGFFPCKITRSELRWFLR
jgi:hypothetical protein